MRPAPVERAAALGLWSHRAAAAALVLADDPVGVFGIYRTDKRLVRLIGLGATLTASSGCNFGDAVWPPLAWGT